VTATVLVIDDERQIRRALRSELAAEGYNVLTAETGEEAMRLAERTPPDLLIVDLGLPGMSGLDVCRAVRARTRCPILVLSARTMERDKVAALDMGADDYLTKPFGMDELLARVRAHVRRWRDQFTPSDVLTAGDLRLDSAARDLTVRGEPVKVTRTEYEILVFLLANAGRVVTHGMLLQHLRGAAHEEDVQSLRVHVARIRKKIELDPARPRFLVTEIGVGYRFVNPD